MLVFKTLPHEICREIGSFLDYSSRAAYNSLLDLDDKFVRKLSSDSHNLQVKVNHMSMFVGRLEALDTIEERAIKSLKMFQYLVDTKDTVLFTHSSDTFRNVILQKMDELYEYIQTTDMPQTMKDTIAQLRINLKKKFTDYPPLKIKCKAMSVKII